VFLESNVGRDPDQRDYIVSNDKIERLAIGRSSRWTTEFAS
jgi:hypothetical protein